MNVESNVVSFPVPKRLDDADMVPFMDHMVKRPRSRKDYLQLCKTYLDEFCYEEVMCSILDMEYYERADNQIKSIVDAYYTFT